MKITKQQLIDDRLQPTSWKIEKSLGIIYDWYKAFGGEVVVNFSGGKDSTVLLWLVRSLFPDVPAIFSHTGLEFPEIISFVKTFPNVTILHPKTTFSEVIRKRGWPLISKRVAHGVSILRNPSETNKNVYRLYNEGVNQKGVVVAGFKLPKRWRFLIDAPFMVSDYCCQPLKKYPLVKHQKKTNAVPYIGLIAADSLVREKMYLQLGCNAYDTHSPRSAPLGFWTEQDVLSIIQTENIPYAEVYGDIIKNGEGLKCTGYHNTGCVFCGFGLAAESDNRFVRLSQTHPKLWDYCMNKLGMKEVIHYCKQNVPHFLKSHFEVI